MNKEKIEALTLCAQNNDIKITYYNYYNNTSATFRGCNTPKRKPNYVSRTKRGYISSLYWYGKDKKGEFVIRESGHWTMRNGIYSQRINSFRTRECRKIASCIWKLKTTLSTSKYAAGKCYLKDFAQIK